jgi:hypothetical protein
LRGGYSLPNTYKMSEGKTASRFLITDRPGANGDNSVSLAPDWPGGNGDNSVPEVDLGDILLAAGVQQTQGRVNATAYDYIIFQS